MRQSFWDEGSTSICLVAQTVWSSDLYETVSKSITKFNSETHIKQIRDLFQIYSLVSSTWISCQVVDNSSLNYTVAEILPVPHVLF